jgi:hypothetical protein
MKYLIWCIVGVIIAGALAWQGLVTGRIAYNEKRNIGGMNARVVGLICLILTVTLAILSVIGINAMIAGHNPKESLIQ